MHEAAKTLGVTPRALRYYEEKGLIRPMKEIENGYRIYSEEDMMRLQWIVTLRELGLPITAISDSLDSLADPAAFIRKMDGARAEMYEEWVSVTQTLQALDDTIAAWHQSDSVRIAQAEPAASRLKQNRLLRSSWNDRWNYDELARRYGIVAPYVHLEGLLPEEHYYQALARTADWLDPQTGERGLELGAGSGNLTVLLASGGAKLTVIEQSAEMLAILRDRLPQVNARQGNLLALPLTSQAYAFIGCSFALHHLNRSQQLYALGEMDRVLMSGGRIVITGLMFEAHDREQRPSSLKELDSLEVTPSLLCELIEWFESRGYSTITEKQHAYTHLVYAVKP
ncbi:MerR family transcriptional regulator [Paenibacillus harenae]|uniref:MerR family transcriptional regulator n=1 Tax=Paenibacillus harenae TaxID=306543 RepID=UPI001FE0DCEA|nr:MerR family transcriptional regulator [Paenibacillus harenae]